MLDEKARIQDILSSIIAQPKIQNILQKLPREISQDLNFILSVEDAEDTQISVPLLTANQAIEKSDLAAEQISSLLIREVFSSLNESPKLLEEIGTAYKNILGNTVANAAGEMPFLAKIETKPMPMVMMGLLENLDSPAQLKAKHFNTTVAIVFKCPCRPGEPVSKCCFV
jgi:hypothetical protein